MSFGYSKQITCADASQIPSTQTDFPIPIFGVFPELANIGFGGKVQSAFGYDIVYGPNQNGSSPYSFEQVAYNAITGEIEYHVRKPSLSAGDQFYRAYGDATISTPQGGAAGAAWESSFKAVWHFPDGSSLTAGDSTTNTNTGTISTPTATSGEIDGAANFNGSSDFINVPNSASINQTMPLTLSAWVLLNSYGGAGNLFLRGILSKYNNAGDNSYFVRVGLDGTNGNKDKLTFGGGSTINDPSAFPLSTFTHVLATVDGAGNAALYINGSSVVTGSITISSTTSDLRIGQDFSLSANQRMWDGKIDESRVAAANRNSGYAKTEYSASKASAGGPSSTFLTYGSEVPLASFTPQRMKRGFG